MFLSYYHRDTFHACPDCGGSVLRIKRRRRDRILSALFGPMHRFRCEALGCTWEGNLRVFEFPSRLEPSSGFAGLRR
jgi:predicted RNA-binding Zn-ribbon protein involved in translation (DUF1610 family)